MPNSGFDVSISRLIVATKDEKEYHFIVREHPIAGKLISLLENGIEYGLIDKQTVNKNRFMRLQLARLDNVKNAVLDGSAEWIWVGMIQSEMFARLATNNEIEFYVDLQENIHILDECEWTLM
ncbi:hypothetical protein J7E43_14755 [Bacillus sp. ISL-8]|uniref:Uncharacterized protein n=1 Tax=Bacillus mycoides TaxID=1405 RepID=A0A1W6AH03_BACMY|nr:hypothetical protein [Bacillus mycoides]ARJ25138.1 hypothetical protein B7492_15425 [Bacillus mycoides]MBT2578643.1 hypothetical protein [Bacillus sp. ISL-8]TKI80251.1 hypothetical protein FC701_29005 [Bacillus mycoides]